MYDKPDSQYSQLVMAAGKAETETTGSSVSEVGSKSAVVGTDSQPKVASCDPPYEGITQEIAYLMSAITNQNMKKIVNKMAQSKITEMLSSLTQNSKDQRRIGKL